MSEHRLAFPEQLGANLLPADESRRIDALFAEWDRDDSPGAALGIYRDGKLVYARGYGMANLEHGIPIVPGSIFHIASISKQFAGLAIALLAHVGKLDVDADIRAWLPEVPDFGTIITLRHLMQHTSGLRDQWALLALAGWREEDLVTDDDVMDLVSRQTALNFPPGDRYMYSNTGFTLMSLIVKRITGQTLRQFTQERIFGPLGMTRTHFHDDHSEIVPGRTQAYVPRDGGGYRISIPEFDVAGATSLFSTVEDFFHWNEQVTTERIASAPVLEEWQRPGTTNDGKDIGYGWGIATERYRGVTLIGHSGADHGYRAHYQRAPGHGLGVAIFSNWSQSNPGQLVHQVFNILLDDVLEPAPAEPGQAETMAGTPDDLDRYAGIYRDPEQALATRMAVRDGALVEGFENPGTLTWLGDRTFRLDEMPGVTFRFDPDAATLTIDFFGSVQHVLRRVTVTPPSPAELELLAGSYASDELGVTWTIAVDGGQAVLKRRKAKNALLVPIGDHVFAAGKSSGALELTIEREVVGLVSGFRLSQSRIRNLAFRRA